MSNHKTPIREVILAVKQLELTIHGQIRLSVFPDEALRYGLKQLAQSTARDKFALLFTICRDYCKNNRLALDWPLFDRLKEEYGYPENPAMTIASTTPQRKPQEPPQRKEWSGHTPGTAHTCTEHAQCLKNKDKKASGWATMSPTERLDYLKSLNPFLLKQLVHMAPQERLSEITEAYASAIHTIDL